MLRMFDRDETKHPMGIYTVYIYTHHGEPGTLCIIYIYLLKHLEVNAI